MEYYQYILVYLRGKLAYIITNIASRQYTSNISDYHWLIYHLINQLELEFAHSYFLGIDMDHMPTLEKQPILHSLSGWRFGTFFPHLPGEGC